MNIIFFILGIVLLLDSLFFIVEGLRFEARQKKLRHSCELSRINSKALSIIVTALNEEKNLPSSLLTLEEQTHKNLEVILVNDRSSDSTGSIMKDFVSRNENWKYLEIQHLPGGWLGKPHALHQGAQIANGEYLIFSDADVHYSPNACQETLNFASCHDLDHLTAGPLFTAKAPLLKAMLMIFSSQLIKLFKPSRIGQDPKAYIGVGAFNMVKNSSYKALGGHEKLRLAVIDDILLGKLFVSEAKKSFFIDGRHLFQLDWYVNARDMIKGLEKNGFAAMQFRWPLLLFTIFLSFTFAVFPYVSLFYAEGAALAMLVGGILFMHLSFAVYAMKISFSPFYTFLVPMAYLLTAYSYLNSAVKVTRSGGIRWRDTFYPLHDLKRFQNKESKRAL